MSDPCNFIIPMVTEVTARSERTYDLFSRLMKDRIIFIGSPLLQRLEDLVVEPTKWSLGIMRAVSVVTLARK